MFLQRLHDAVVFLLHVERRFEPFFRPAVDAVLREPLALLTQALINLGRHDEGLRLAEEKIQPDEEAHLQRDHRHTGRIHVAALAARKLSAGR